MATVRTVLLVVALLSIGPTARVFGTTPILLSADLTPFADIHRLVVVFPGDCQKEEAFLDQWDSDSVHSGMEHRSLLVFRVTDRNVINGLRKQMAPRESGFRIWLIGRNGHLVFSTTRDIDPWEIFARIDAMPGRRAEVERHNDWDAGHQTSP